MYPNPFHTLFSRRSDLARKLSELRCATLEAERAISLCDQLKDSIPAKITAIKSQRSDPHWRETPSLEDSLPNGKVLVQERRAVASLEKILADLPAIRAHWDARLQAIGA